jgi:hypothetical protein
MMLILLIELRRLCVFLTWTFLNGSNVKQVPIVRLHILMNLPVEYLLFVVDVPVHLDGTHHQALLAEGDHLLAA